jgi:hypothetical protein
MFVLAGASSLKPHAKPAKHVKHGAELGLVVGADVRRLILI